MGWIKYHTDEFTHDVSKMDALYWSGIVDKSDTLKGKLPRRADQIIAGDLFESLYDWSPRLKHDEDSPNPAIAEYIRQLGTNPDFKKLRERTVGDKTRASASASRLYRELMRSRLGEKSDLSTMADFKDRVDTYEDMGDADNPAVAALKAAEQAMADQFREQGIGELTDEGLDNGKAELIHQALTNTDSAMQMTEDLVGFESDATRSKGHTTGGPATERLVGDLMDEGMARSFQSSDRLKQLLKIAGRMRVILQQEKSKKPKKAPPPIGITYGDDLGSLLAQEVALLSDVDTEDVFFQRFSNGGLMIYDRKAKLREGRGPFVALVDISGSMTGQPETMAYAMFIALAREALKQGRRALFIPFASHAGKPLDVSHASDLFTMAGYKPRVGGGTDFMRALDEARNSIDGTGGKWKNADIVLISDGDAYVRDSWVDTFKKWQVKTGVRLIGVMVGHPSQWQAQLQSVMTSSVSIKDEGGLADMEWFRAVSKAVI